MGPSPPDSPHPSAMRSTKDKPPPIGSNPSSQPANAYGINYGGKGSFPLPGRHENFSQAPARLANQQQQLPRNTTSTDLLRVANNATRYTVVPAHSMPIQAASRNDLPLNAESMPDLDKSFNTNSRGRMKSASGVPNLVYYPISNSSTPSNDRAATKSDQRAMQTERFYQHLSSQRLQGGQHNSAITSPPVRTSLPSSAQHYDRYSGPQPGNHQHRPAAHYIYPTNPMNAGMQPFHFSNATTEGPSSDSYFRGTQSQPQEESTSTAMSAYASHPSYYSGPRNIQPAHSRSEFTGGSLSIGHTDAESNSNNASNVQYGFSQQRKVEPQHVWKYLEYEILQNQQKYAQFLRRWPEPRERTTENLHALLNELEVAGLLKKQTILKNAYNFMEDAYLRYYDYNQPEALPFDEHASYQSIPSPSGVTNTSLPYYDSSDSSNRALSKHKQIMSPVFQYQHEAFPQPFSFQQPYSHRPHSSSQQQQAMKQYMQPPQAHHHQHPVLNEVHKQHYQLQMQQQPLVSASLGPAHPDASFTNHAKALSSYKTSQMNSTTREDETHPMMRLLSYQPDVQNTAEARTSYYDAHTTTLPQTSSYIHGSPLGIGNSRRADMLNNAVYSGLNEVRNSGGTLDSYATSIGYTNEAPSTTVSEVVDRKTDGFQGDRGSITRLLHTPQSDEPKKGVRGKKVTPKGELTRVMKEKMTQKQKDALKRKHSGHIDSDVYRAVRSQEESTDSDRNPRIIDTSVVRNTAEAVDTMLKSSLSEVSDEASTVGPTSSLDGGDVTIQKHRRLISPIVHHFDGELESNATASKAAEPYDLESTRSFLLLQAHEKMRAAMSSSMEASTKRSVDNDVLNTTRMHHNDTLMKSVQDRKEVHTNNMHEASTEEETESKRSALPAILSSSLHDIKNQVLEASLSLYNKGQQQSTKKNAPHRTTVHTSDNRGSTTRSEWSLSSLRTNSNDEGIPSASSDPSFSRNHSIMNTSKHRDRIGGESSKTLSRVIPTVDVSESLLLVEATKGREASLLTFNKICDFSRKVDDVIKMKLRYASEEYNKRFGTHVYVKDVSECSEYLKQQFKNYLSIVWKELKVLHSLRRDSAYFCVSSKPMSGGDTQNRGSRLVIEPNLHPLVTFYKQSAIKASQNKLSKDVRDGHQGRSTDARRTLGRTVRKELSNTYTKHKNEGNHRDDKLGNDEGGNDFFSSLFENEALEGTHKKQDVDICYKKAEEYAEVSISQRRLIDKVSTLEYRAFLESGKAKRLLPEKFRFLQLRTVEEVGHEMKRLPSTTHSVNGLPSSSLPLRQPTFSSHKMTVKEKAAQLHRLQPHSSFSKNFPLGINSNASASRKSLSIFKNRKIKNKKEIGNRLHVEKKRT